MSAADAAGLALLALPVAFNVLFARLARTFDYPDVLREEPRAVLVRFAAGGTALVLTWWAFALTALALAPAVVLLASALPGADPAVLRLGAAAGVLAALVQVLGLVRWPFLVPHLARAAADPALPEARREASIAIFDALNRFLGVGVGEHLGYALTGAWTALASVALAQAGAPALAVPGGVVAIALAVCSLEFVGRHEPAGWAAAGRAVPVAYVAWSAWLAATGVWLLA
jgi:hypothetical protein